MRKDARREPEAPSSVGRKFCERGKSTILDGKMEGHYKDIEGH